ncbi:hypothetical protein KI688_004935 [Linnemannia hyalina]|uniref:Uncharacterized protein n=1 Tax=Linnemannia hyalina TaxID=64524 RepID=A0A9P7XKA7_9FUNG|nr:hypothetical protein KI688_004935 [Linnemannia hyalina]
MMRSFAAPMPRPSKGAHLSSYRTPPGLIGSSQRHLVWMKGTQLHNWTQPHPDRPAHHTMTARKAHYKPAYLNDPVKAPISAVTGPHQGSSGSSQRHLLWMKGAQLHNRIQPHPDRPARRGMHREPLNINHLGCFAYANANLDKNEHHRRLWVSKILSLCKDSIIECLREQQASQNNCGNASDASSGDEDEDSEEEARGATRVLSKQFTL